MATKGFAHATVLTWWCHGIFPLIRVLFNYNISRACPADQLRRTWTVPTLKYSGIVIDTGYNISLLSFRAHNPEHKYRHHTEEEWKEGWVGWLL